MRKDRIGVNLSDTKAFKGSMMYFCNTMKLFSIFAAILLSFLCTCACGAEVYNDRYCEIFEVTETGFQIWSTTPTGDPCDQELWDEWVADTTHPTFLPNGPRYWVINEVLKDEPADYEPKQQYFNGMLFATLPAILPLSTEEGIYGYQKINRQTVYVFNEGTELYALHNGTDYFVMQSYSHQVSSSLTIDSLPTLDDRLELNKGWSYHTCVVGPSDSYFFLYSNYQATLTQDDYKNTYQLVYQGWICTKPCDYEDNSSRITNTASDSSRLTLSFVTIVIAVLIL